MSAGLPSDQDLDIPDFLKVENRQTTSSSGHKQFHPVANVFPLLDSAELDELVADVKSQGLREPIVLCEDKILDGRNRYRACKEAGVEPRFINYEGDDPLAYVISVNLRRRHLAAGQREAVLKELIKARPELSNRQIAAKARVSHPTVGKVRKKLERTGDVEKVSTSVDTKGRAQPRTKSRKTAHATAPVVRTGVPQPVLQETAFNEALERVIASLGPLRMLELALARAKLPYEQLHVIFDRALRAVEARE
jgi:DNA-binding Lrp family transcriptional regulator